jgi:hypothetical protein
MRPLQLNSEDKIEGNKKNKLKKKVTGFLSASALLFPPLSPWELSVPIPTMLSWGEVLIPMHVNVGPGCSSVGVGAFSENGPFRPSGKALVRNEYSWNKGEHLSCKRLNVGGPGRCRANLFFLCVCVCAIQCKLR